MVLDERDYGELAQAELGAVLTALDRLDGVDAEQEGDLLRVEVPGGGEYVLNTQSAARQLWLAAEQRAWHFDWDGASRRWVAAKNGDELWETLSRLLAARLGPGAALRR